jgi:hypothetical protein
MKVLEQDMHLPFKVQKDIKKMKITKQRLEDGHLFLEKTHVIISAKD